MRAPPRARTGARPPLDWHGARNGRTWCGGYNANRMIIQSLLDTDLYKFTMMQVVLHHFPGAQVEYRFRCRTEGVDLRPHLDAIRARISTRAGAACGPRSTWCGPSSPSWSSRSLTSARGDASRPRGTKKCCRG